MKEWSVEILSFFKYTGEAIGHSIAGLIFFLVTFFSPAGLVLAAVGFSVLVDTYFGRWRARHDKEEVTSKITRVSITNKSIGYMLVVLGSFLIDKAFMNEIVINFFKVEYTVTKLVGLTFCWIEYTSVNESYKKVKGISIGQAIRGMLRGVKIVKEEVYNIKDKDGSEGDK